MIDEIHSGGAHSFVEKLSDATQCSCGDSALSVEDRGDTTLYGRVIRRIVCSSCGQHGPWGTAPVALWNVK